MIILSLLIIVMIICGLVFSVGMSILSFLFGWPGLIILAILIIFIIVKDKKKKQ